MSPRKVQGRHYLEEPPLRHPSIEILSRSGRNGPSKTSLLSTNSDIFFPQSRRQSQSSSTVTTESAINQTIPKATRVASASPSTSKKSTAQPNPCNISGSGVKRKKIAIINQRSYNKKKPDILAAGSSHFPESAINGTIDIPPSQLPKYKEIEKARQRGFLQCSRSELDKYLKEYKPEPEVFLAQIIKNNCKFEKLEAVILDVLLDPNPKGADSSVSPMEVVDEPSSSSSSIVTDAIQNGQQQPSIRLDDYYIPKNIWKKAFHEKNLLRSGKILFRCMFSADEIRNCTWSGRGNTEILSRRKELAIFRKFCKTRIEIFKIIKIIRI
jgi:hypothetical protein